MPGPLDDTLKHLTELSPQDWVVRGGWSAAPATLIDADTFIETLLEGVTAMEESVTYQKIIRKGEAKGKAEGKAEEARRILLLQGRHRFGEPSAEVVATLGALTDVEKLEHLTVRMLEATNWQDLLS